MHMDGERKRTTSEGARDGGIYAVFRWMLTNGLRLMMADFVIPNLTWQPFFLIDLATPQSLGPTRQAASLRTAFYTTRLVQMFRSLAEHEKKKSVFHKTLIFDQSRTFTINPHKKKSASTYSTKYSNLSNLNYSFKF